MVKKTSTRSQKTKHVSVSPTHLMVKRSIVSYAVIVFVAFATISMSIYLLERMTTARINQDRLSRITAVYNDIDLDSSYRIAYTDVFGDKRVYDGEAKDRTYASRIEYGHNDTVSNTLASVQKRVEDAGFTYVETAYDGTAAKQLVFKNDSNEFVRVNVVTKAHRDMITYGAPSQEEWLTVDQNAAPSYVTVLVNIDSNAE